jgi:hypothetical protein
MISADEEYNFSIFRDNLSVIILSSSPRANKSAVRAKSRKGKKQDDRQDNPAREISEQDVDQIAEFVDVSSAIQTLLVNTVYLSRSQYLSTEIFMNFSSDLRCLNYSAAQSHPSIADRYTSQAELESLSYGMPASVSESLDVYTLPDLQSILANSVPAYISAVTAPPPIWATTKPDACELCERNWIPLTYHHLIPRSMHDKVLKRGWHEEWELNKVAWLCAACHRCVHRAAPNEELARHWDTVDKLRSREDIQKFIKWVGRVRWKKK